MKKMGINYVPALIKVMLRSNFDFFFSLLSNCISFQALNTWYHHFFFFFVEWALKMCTRIDLFPIR